MNVGTPWQLFCWNLYRIACALLVSVGIALFLWFAAYVSILCGEHC